ncbi:protein SSX4 [Rousettus aegyptiacus]|uniref:protein SSX4 n=1 Tax=Rousettus aegyptiacus TaxID=9407 RepID=UPI00168CF6E6|nr:protein SSX4 [Rousettus aegyptiacus]XP_015997293.2 protein SSX4 [Rousettus aegyptiacus]
MDRPKFTTASFLRILGLRTGKTQAVSHPVQTDPTAMNRGSSFAKSSGKDSQKSEEKCKAFKDICKYFSKEEWAKLGNSQKYTYVYMKRNYDTMTSLGLNATLPAFMNPNKQTAKSPENEDQNPWNQDGCPQETSDLQHLKEMPKKPGSKEHDLKTLPETHCSKPAQKQLCPSGKANASGLQTEKSAGPRTLKTNVWAYRLRERKNTVVFEEISDPKEDD